MRTRGTLEDELDRYSVTYSKEQGGRHPYFSIVTPKGTFKFFFSSTSTDWRGVLNSRAALRRLLSKYGAELRDASPLCGHKAKLIIIDDPRIDEGLSSGDF